MSTAPFQRLADKVFFVLGSMIVVGYGYVIGKYPNDWYYSFYTGVMALLLIARLVHFVKCGWKYYLIDFCYYANSVILYMINFGPKTSNSSRQDLSLRMGSWATRPTSSGIASSFTRST